MESICVGSGASHRREDWDCASPLVILQLVWGIGVEVLFSFRCNSEALRGFAPVLEVSLG